MNKINKNFEFFMRNKQLNGQNMYNNRNISFKVLFDKPPHI